MPARTERDAQIVARLGLAAAPKLEGQRGAPHGRGLRLSRASPKCGKLRDRHDGPGERGGGKVALGAARPGGERDTAGRDNSSSDRRAGQSDRKDKAKWR